MRRLILAGLLASAALAQNPNTAIYPGGIAADADLLVASNRASTTLNGAINASVTNITVASTSLFIVPCVLTIDNENLKATAKTATTFTVTRAFDGTSAASHSNGVAVRGNITRHHHNQLAAEVKAIETALGASFSGANMPSAGEKAALAGTSGTPGAGNKYVTDADSRNTDARTPTAHATSHKNGGSDEVAAAAAAANVIPKAGADGRLAVGFGPLLVDTADRGYFFGMTVQAPDSAGATNTFTANVQRVWQFVLPFAVTVNQVTFEVIATSGVCGGTCSLNLGLWDAACTTVVAQAGVMTSGGSPDINVAGYKNKAIVGGPVTLNPGIYWLAMTTDSTTLTLRSTNIPSQVVIGLLNQQTNKKFAQAGNNGAAGVFPASCGTVTTAANNQPPLVLFER